MILQLHGYPVLENGTEISASTPEHYDFVARLMRYMLLNESDWTMVMDSPLTSEQRSEWAEWRRYLRDLPASFPEELSATLEIVDPPVHHRPVSWVNLSPRPTEHTHDDGHTHFH
jgi:hypothetical protein